MTQLYPPVAVSIARPEAPAAEGGLSWAGEVCVWALFAVLLGSVEGSVVSVVVKSLYKDAASPGALDSIVAMLVGAANVAHFAGLGWAWAARRRDPSRLLVHLQALCALCLALVASAPRSAAGLVMMVAGAMGARLVWSGLMTLRTSVWRRLHGRAERARLGGTVVALHYLLVAATGAGVGAVVSAYPSALRWLHLGAACLGLAGAALYAALERRALQRSPRDDDGGPASGHWSLRRCAAILRSDAPFRRYLASFFALDTGVMMTVAPLVIFLHDRSGMPGLSQTLLVTTVPTLAVPLVMPLFARRLGRTHVVRFRALQSWCSVAAVALFALGAAASAPACLWAGSFLLGAGYAGGSISWHLGIHDFAPAERAPDYMALNVALTGVRGLFAPALGVLLYRAIESARPGGGALSLVVSVAVTAGGALGFVALSRSPAIPWEVRR